jgi:selenium-binding protein 1
MAWHLGYDTAVTMSGARPTCRAGWSRAAAREQVRPAASLLGPPEAAPHPGDRLGAEHQLVFELRPAHDPTKACGFVNCVVSLKDLSSSIWVWHRDGDQWAATKVIEIPAEPTDPDRLPPAIRTSRPPAAGDRHRSLARRSLPLRVLLGTGDPAVRRLDPFKPGSPARCASAASSRAHRIRRSRALNGGPRWSR